MANVEFKRDTGGIAAILKSGAFAGAVAERAASIASAARSARPEADIVVDHYTTDRAAASVTVRHRNAQQWQAEQGLLTRAAAGAGLEVTGR